MFRLSLKALHLFFYQLGTMLSAGLPVRRALATLEKATSGRLRGICARIGGELEQGESLAGALTSQASAFPRMARNLVAAGERSGALDETCSALAAYFEMMRGIIRKFTGKIALPVLQFLAAVAILALVKWIAQSFIPKSGLAAQTGFLDSPAGILLCGWGLLPLAVVLYLVITRVLGGARIMHEILLRAPVLNKLMLHFALGRFFWALSFCMNAGMGAVEALAVSAKASGNAAFEDRAQRALELVREGNSMREALAALNLLSVVDLEMVAVAEESGSSIESFQRLSRHHFEAAEFASGMFARVMAGAIWLVVVIFIIVQIFRFASMYISGLTM